MTIQKNDSTKVILIEESKKTSKRLGRHVEHDPRSRNYATSFKSFKLKTTVFKINIPVLDQGSVGSCTGNAALACIGSSPFYSTLPKTNAMYPNQNAAYDERIAVNIYKAATKVDDVYGVYPPDDTGSTGLAVAKVFKRAGLISSYQHAFSLEQALLAISNGPVITGVNWYEGFDYPDMNGRVSIDGEVRGGHEFLLYGLDVRNQLVLARNSWGKSWGNKGNFSFSWDDFERLLDEYGDVTIFNKLTANSKK